MSKEMYNLTEDAIRELLIDVSACTIIDTMKKDLPFVTRKMIKKRLLNTNFDKFVGQYYITEEQAEAYMVRYYDIGHDIVATWDKDK